MKKIGLFIFGLFLMSAGMAQQKINMNASNEELLNLISIYSKASGQKFVIDPSVRGKITILLPEPVSLEEAFNHLSSALAVNGYAISKQGDTMVIKSARNIQRDLIEVSSEKPSIKPERMYTWIYQGKYVSVDKLTRELRIMNSKDGEISPFLQTNQIIITDWTSNLQRVAQVLQELDKPVDAKTTKLIDTAFRELEREKLRNLKKSNPVE